MKELLRSHSVSYVQGVRVALEAHGIETVVFDQQTVGFDGFAGRVRLMVGSDADFERARRLLQELEVPAAVSRHPESVWKVQRWGCAALAAGVVLLVTSLGVFSERFADPDASRLVPYALVGGSVLIAIIGATVIALAPRRDPPREPHT